MCRFKALNLVRSRNFALLALTSLILTLPLSPAAQAASARWKVQGAMDQDFPFQGACIGATFPAGNIAYKGLTLKLGNEAYMCFDTDDLRMVAGWTGGYLNFDGVAYSGSHGNHPTIAGNQKFGTKSMPGVADETGSFKDTRLEPFGPIPAKVGHWNGLYVNGDDVVLSYTVGGTKILEMPASVAADGQVGFIRNFKTEKNKTPISIVLCEADTTNTEISDKHVVLHGKGTNITIVELVDAPRGAKLEVIDNQRVILKLDKKTKASTFKVVIWNGPEANRVKFAGLLAGKAQVADIKKPGPARWPETVVTKVVMNANSTPDGAYTLDQLTPPTENPWKRQVRIGGFDFFSDGKRAAVCTWDGDIWIVSGLDDKLNMLTWKRFASGGYETLGLKIVNDVIYTSGRDQITRYHDFNNDGEADYYENFNNQITSSDGFHEFVFDLQTDSKGNFYTAKAGPVRGGGRGFGGDNYGTISEHAGTLLKISKDGSKLEVYATGFRAPNGMGMGPHDEITTSDNEGTWVPTTPINWIKQGGFYGVESTAHHKPVPTFEKPVCWLSHNDFDNSGGAQAWVTSDKWGPLKDEMLHMSYGKCTLFLVMKETVNGTMQGGVVKIPVKFTSSSMRGRFNAKDGQLYIGGLQGWQTSAVKLAGFDRVRYTGKPVHTVNSLHVTKTGIELGFTEPLDPASANDVQNYSGKRWNYHRCEDYGSPEFSVADPSKQGRDALTIQSAKLSPDGKTVTLQIADLKPVMQQMISFDLKAKDGADISQTIQHTIHVLP
ncbi:MAG: Cytochrome c oxidase polypeptide [Pedosphaera sp.]|nr:Cytochrome c oxidase polypeptide [Pedosphaera sp.]